MQFFVNDIPADFKFKGSLAIDTEAMGLNNHRDRLCMIQVCDEDKNVALIHFPVSNYSYDCVNLRKYILDKNVQKIFHFARFDVAIMKHYLKIDEIPNIFCTKIASKFVRTYTDKHGLKNIVSEFFGIELKKEQRSSNWGQDVITFEQKKYAEQDVIYLHEMKKQLEIMLKQANRYDMACKFFEFINSVCDADLSGFKEDIFSHEYSPLK